MEKKHVIDNPKLMAEWNFEKNIDLDPSKLTLGSSKKVWWKCKKGHEWEATIYIRNFGNGCPYCSNKKVLKGYNDLRTLNPDLAKEWNYEKNEGLKPEHFTPNSGKIVWWKCKMGHEWKSSIHNRNYKHGCPYCAGKKAIKGVNDLSTLNSTLSKEWNYEKNNSLRPENFTVNSGKKVWWKCSKGHEWQATIHNRNNGTGCPYCDLQRNTSFPEYALLYYIEKQGLDAIHLYKENGYELDIYIPSKKIAIEYDGSFWHKNRVKKDLEKNAKCKNNGIKLYRIREELPSLNDYSIDCTIQESQKDLQEVLSKILSEIVETNVDVNLKRDFIGIENLREHAENENSLLFSNPVLTKEWNYEKNKELKPTDVTPGSSKKVWWICNKGHEWQAIICDRNKGSGCPYCSGRKK